MASIAIVVVVMSTAWISFAGTSLPRVCAGRPLVALVGALVVRW
jgi:hypothetical protein